jgi:hypothetical protein
VGGTPGFLYGADQMNVVVGDGADLRSVSVLIYALTRLSEVYPGFVSTGRCDMTGAREKNVHRLAERKGFRLDKVGKGQHRFYIIDLESSGRMFSGVPDHEYSFSLEQAVEWLAARDDSPKGK